MNAQQLKNSILQEAIEGRLVPQDPNDEPASVLLDKIRKEKARLVKEKKIKADKNESYIYRSGDGHWMEHFEDKKRDEICIDDDIPFVIPKGWVWTRLNSLAEIVRGGSPRPAGSPEFYGGEIPFLKVADLTKDDSMYVKTHTATIKEAGLKKTREVVPDTLLLTNSGATLGVPKICTFKTTFNDGIAAFLCLSDNLKPYLFWFLCAKTEAFRSINQGTAQPNLNTDIIKDTLLAMPPLEEQKRIVRTIEKLMPLVKEYGKAQDKLNKLNEELPERLKKSILQEAIEGRLVPQDPNDEPASVLLEKIHKEKARLVKEGKLKKKDLVEIPIEEDEIPFKIPESWEWHRIGYLANLYTGNSISKDIKESKYMNVKGRWYIGTKDVNFDNTIDYDNGVYIPEIDEPQFKIASTGSILMCIEGGSAGRKIGIIDRDVCFGNKLCCFNSYGIYNLFLYYYLQSSIFKQIFNDNKKGIIGGVSINMMSPLLIPVPPLAEQKRIVAKIEQLLHEIDKLKV